jgi:hypothetical protein
MIFTSLGKIIAWLTLIVGSLRVSAGILVASIDDPERYAFAANRYLSSTSGETIDKGIYTILIGVTLGILAEISSSVSMRRTSEEK